MKRLILTLGFAICLAAPASAQDLITVLNGTMYRIDEKGNLWRQQGSYWIEVRRDGAWKNSQKIAASPSDGLLIVLQNNYLHRVNPDTGGYIVLTNGITYDPRKMTGLCGFKKYAYFIYDETLMRVRLDGT